MIEYKNLIFESSHIFGLSQIMEDDFISQLKNNYVNSNNGCHFLDVQRQSIQKTIMNLSKVQVIFVWCELEK
jgi:hypothetical protein